MIIGENSKLISYSTGYYVVLPIVGGKTYTISKQNSRIENSKLRLSIATTKNYPDVDIAFVDAWSAYNSQYQCTIETSNSAKYLFVGLAAGTPLTEEEKQLAYEELKVEYGSKASAYTQYNRGSLDVCVEKKFEADDVEWTKGKFLDIYGNEGIEPNWQYSDYIDIHDGNYRMTTTSSGPYAKHILYDSEKNMIDYQNANSGDFAIKDNSYYIRVCITINSESNFKIYKQKTVSVMFPEDFELCRIAYESAHYDDYIYKSEEKWYKHKLINKLVLDGTENFSSTPTTFDNVTRFSVPLSGADQGAKQISTHFNYATGYSADEEHFYIYNNVLFLFVDNSIATTVEQLKTWLAQQYENKTPVTIYYVLKTEIEQEITDAGTVGQLNKLQDLELYTGRNNVFVKSDPQAILTMEYYKIIEDFNFYISEDGYLVIPEYKIKYLIDFNESSIPSMPEATEATVRIAGRDGDIVLKTTYEPIPFNITCYTKDNLDSEEKTKEETKVNHFLNSIKNSTIALAIEKGNKFYNVKYSGALTTINYPKHLKFNIPLKSSDSYAKNYQKTMIAGSKTFTSDTIKEVGARFIISGPATNPKLALNDYLISYDNPILEGTKLIIDSNKSTVVLVATARTTNAMANYNHQFPKIQPGLNKFKVNSGISNETQVTVEWYDLKL